MSKVCHTPDCDATIPPQRGSARPRKYCVTCRPPRNRENPRVIPLLDHEEPTGSRPPVSLEDTYRKHLELAERLETPEGAHVMLLAQLLAAGEHTASGAAALSKELRAAMTVALKDAPTKSDFLDELADRRRSKAAGA
jgi:hypothetical protein